jgi:gamma-glutamylaminecyclotransferase
MYVFVYGTLKRGFHNHDILRGSEFVGKGVTLARFNLRCCGFPVALTATVADHSILFDLDRLEGVPHMYTRETVKVDVPSRNKQYEVFMYVGNPEHWSRSRLLSVPINDYGFYEWTGEVRMHSLPRPIGDDHAEAHSL